MASHAPAVYDPAASITVVVKGDPTKQMLGDCPFCHRVLLTLCTKGLPYNLELVDFASKPQWLVDGFDGKVPVIKALSDGNLTMMSDSDKIVVFLEDKFPEPSLKSDAPEGITGKVWAAYKGYLQSTDADADQKREALLAELTSINEYLSAPGKGPLFGGKTLDMTDAAFAPKLYHTLVALSHFKGFELPLSYSAIWRYIGYVQLQASWQKCDYGADKIIEGWLKHLAS